MVIGIVGALVFTLFVALFVVLVVASARRGAGRPVGVTNCGFIAWNGGGTGYRGLHAEHRLHFDCGRARGAAGQERPTCASDAQALRAQLRPGAERVPGMPRSPYATGTTEAARRTVSPVGRGR